MQLVVGTYERFLLGYTVPDSLEVRQAAAALPYAVAACFEIPRHLSISSFNRKDRHKIMFIPTRQGVNVELVRSFTHASHQGPVRCVDAAGAFVVSGGQDDQLHLYDVKVGGSCLAAGLHF